jgi:hypothetical protein
MGTYGLSKTAKLLSLPKGHICVFPHFVVSHVLLVVDITTFRKSLAAENYSSIYAELFNGYRWLEFPPLI